MAGTESRLVARPWEADVDSVRHCAADADGDPARISLEIARTRQRMDRTLSELRGRLSDVSQSVRKTALNSLMWAGVGVLAVGVLWLGLKARKARTARLAAAAVRPVGLFAGLRDRLSRRVPRRRQTVIGRLACHIASIMPGSK